MRVLLINKFYYLRGGAERYFFDLKKLLEENGHTVIPFSMAHKKNKRAKYEKYFADEVEFKTSPNPFLRQASAKTANRRSKFFVMRAGNCIKIFYNRDAIRKLEKLIQDERPDIAHLHNIAHQLSPAIIWILKKYNIPIVQTLHDYKLICPSYLLFDRKNECHLCSGGRYYNCFLRKCVKESRAKSFIGMCEAYLHNKIFKTYDKVDLFIAPTNFVKNVCARAGIEGNRIKVVKSFLCGLAGSEESGEGKEGEDGKDGEDGSRDAIYRISTMAEKRRDRQKKLEIRNCLPACLRRRAQAGLPAEVLTQVGKLEIKKDYLLYFGRLSVEKGIYVLLEAMKRVDTKLNLKIVGDGPEFFNLKFKIINLKLESRVEILGARYGFDLEKIILGATAIIIPSICPESMCYSLLEAMALGKIVIASRIGAIEEFVEDGKNGFLFEPGDSYGLAKKINYLFCGKESDLLRGLTPLDVSDISRKAQKMAPEMNSKRHYEEIMKIYNSLNF